jgi:hypothetical protein
MKKDQLTCTKGTRKSAIRKTYIFPPIPNLPVIKNIQEAFDYIFIQHKTKGFLEKEVKHWKDVCEISRDTREIMESTLKLKDEHIERLKMGDMAPDTFVELTNNLERQRTVNRVLEKEIKQLKTELKRSKKFHYQDFILN